MREEIYLLKGAFHIPCPMWVNRIVLSPQFTKGKTEAQRFISMSQAAQLEVGVSSTNVSPQIPFLLTYCSVCWRKLKCGGQTDSKVSSATPSLGDIGLVP